MVFDGFKMQMQYSKLKEMQAMGEITTRLNVENLIANLTAQYYNHVQQKIRLKNLKYAVALSKERLRIVEAQYNIGSMSRLDLQQARVYFNADSSSLIKQFELVNASAIALNELMAVENISEKILLTDSIISLEPMPRMEELWERTLETNTSLLLSSKNKTLSELEKKSIQSRNYPYLRLDGGYGYTANVYQQGNYDKQNQLGFNYSLTLGFTVFDGMNRRREQKNAEIALRNKELETEQLELMLRADLANMWMSYQNNLELINLEKSNLLAAREAYEIAIERYRLNDLSGLELREAQNSLLEAEERLLQAMYNTKLYEISLLQLSGQVAYYLE